MDELTLLRDLRNDIGTPTDAAVERGRRKLQRRLDPPQRQPAVRRRPRRSAPRIILTSVAAAALIAALVAGDVVGPAGWRGGATAEAAEVLNSAALAAIETSDPEIQPGQYLKIDSTSVWPTFSQLTDGSETPVAWLATEESTMYIPADRKQEWVWQRSGRVPTTFFDETSKAYALNNYSPQADGGYLLRGDNGAFYDQPPEASSWPSAELLDSLPRDPYLLLNNIYKRTLGQGRSIDGQALVFIADLLRTGLVPADLRAALFKAATMIPGVTVTERQATLDGRTGIAIGRVEETAGSRQDIIIDPETGLLIGEREVLIESDGVIPAGTATTWTSIRTSVADAAP